MSKAGSKYSERLLYYFSCIKKILHKKLDQYPFEESFEVSQGSPNAVIYTIKDSGNVGIVVQGEIVYSGSLRAALTRLSYCSIDDFSDCIKKTS